MAISIRSVTPTITTANPITVNTPSDTAAGDVLVIIHGNDYYALSNMPTPTVGGSSTGVNAITDAVSDQGTNQAHVKAYTFVVASGGAQTVSVTETGSADEDKCLAVYALTGVDTTTPADVAGNAGSATAQTSHVLPSISPASPDAFLIAHLNTGSGASTSSYTAPGSMTEQYDSLVGGVTHTGATEQLSASGATGTRTFTPATNVVWGGVIIAVKTASAAAPTYAMLRPAVVAP